jgi:hypothetical protein
MTWLRLDDKWNRSPKVAALPRDVRLFLVDCWTHCSDQLTDGFVGRAMLPIVSPGESLRSINGWIKRLEKGGLLHLCSDRDGWLCHDFLDWNPSREEVLRSREQSRSRARKCRESRTIDSDVTPHVRRTCAVSNAEVTEQACAARAHAVTAPRPDPSDPSSDPTDRVGASAPPPPVLTVQEPEPPKTRKPRQVALPAVKIPQSVGWDIWREVYAKSRRAYGAYTDAPGDGKAMGRVVDHAAKLVRDNLRGLGMVALDPEPNVRNVLRHWFIAFLRDDGDRGFLADNRHSLRYLENGIPKYGMPRFDERPTAPAPPAEAAAASAPGIPPPGFDAAVSTMFSAPGGVN